MFEYKTLIVQDISTFPGPHVTDIDGQSLVQVKDEEDGSHEYYNYIPLHIALNQFGRDGWQIDQVIQHVIDGAIIIMKRQGQAQA
ncbi:MAG TPA: hypothetical protein VH186_06690 [Chloroflexia bacterium]|nr:hypothetical protein [Chloroflexia bacterium]